MPLVLSESKTLRIGSMMTFYVAQGLPIGLYVYAITVWLAGNGGSEAAVAAIIATVFLPWSFKFLGAAIMDMFTYLPMGRRRIWLILSQAIMLGGLCLAAAINPAADQVALIGWIGFAIFCGSAIQDVAVDGLAVDILPDEEQGFASAFMFGGQALGIAGGTAIGGYLLQHYGAGVAFLAFTPLNVCFLLLAIVLRERPGEKLLPWTKGEASAVARERHGVTIRQIIEISRHSLFRRDSLVLVFSSGVGRAAGGIFTAFWPIFAAREAGWSTSGYSSMVGAVGLVTSVACMGIGTLLVGRLGPRLATVVTYAGYGIMALIFLFVPELATIGWVFVILTVYWNATDTLTSVCSNPLRMRLSDKRLAATHFTIYNSLGNLTVPMGAALFAWASGYGSIVLMPVTIALVLLCCIGYGMMRIGGRTEPLEELEPRVN